MAKGNKGYKQRLNNAVNTVIEKLNLDEPRVRRMYTAVWRNRAYRWISPMDSDGLLIKERNVHDDDDLLGEDVYLRIGVVVQSEFTTSLTKANPVGKALISAFPYGVWVDLTDDGRVRLDRVYVLFVVPKATAAGKKVTSAKARQNVDSAASASREAHVLEVGLGDSSAVIARKLLKKVNRWLVGAGRPAG